MSNASEWYRDDVALLGELRRGNIDDVRPPAIAGYEDFREIRRGGQGIVYTAIQRSTRRRVAIKLIRERGLTSRTGRRRFEREVDLIASLRHPNIVRIYDSGFTHDGRPYFVMEYIEGLALDEYVRDTLVASAGGTGLKDLLRLVQRIADAVSHAHKHGVVHRDLKPSNIRVDAAAEPHVLDFGLAKLVADVEPDATRSVEVSVTGQFMGSLPWASPEQAEGASDRIDVRTDVYALGVILYQMLTGSFPYEVVGSLRDVLNNIITVAPTRPSSVHHRIDDEIETIVLKCLAKEPERRYQSARALADDIGRYLAGEPIEAKRDSAWYTLRKTVRRYRAAVAFTSIALVLSLGFGIAMSVLYRKASRAEKIAADRLTETVDARNRAETERVRAEQSVRFLSDMLESVNPERARGRDVSVLREVLDDTARRIERELADQPVVRATLHTTLGRTYRAIGRVAEADHHLTAAYEISETSFGENAPRTLVAMSELGTVRMNQGRLDEARELLETAYAKRDLVGADTREAVILMGNLGALRTREGNLVAAKRLCEQALQSARRLFGADDTQTLIAMNNLAGLLQRAGQYAEAEQLDRDLLAARQRLLGDDHPDTILSLMNLAALLRQTSRFKEAEQTYERVIELSRKVYGPEHPSTLAAQANLVAALHALGKTEEAAALGRRTLEVQRRVVGMDHDETLTTAVNLAYALTDLHQYDEAESLYREALSAAERVYGPDHAIVATILNNLAYLLQSKGNLEEAQPLFERALAVRRRILGDDHPHTLVSISNLAALYQAQGALGKAEPLYRESLERRRALLGTNTLDTAISCNNLANLLLQCDRPAEAEPYCREAVDIAQRILPTGHWIIAAFQGNLGACLLQIDQREEAEAVLLEAHASLSQSLGADDAKTQGVLKRIVELYETWGRPSDAAQYAALLPGGGS